MEMQGASIALILSTIFMSSVMSQDPPAVPAVPDVPGAECPLKFTKLSKGCYHYEESPMAWEAAKAYCTNLGAGMVVVENEEERTEIIKMASEPISRKARFWLDVKKMDDSWMTHDSRKVPTFTPWGDIATAQKGDCIRSGPDLKWYGWDCASTSVPGGYTLNPLCKIALPGPVEDVGFNETWPFNLKKNNLITELPFVGKEYKLSFEVKITSFGADAYQSVIHLTIGGNAESYGDRTPGVWITNTKLFCIASAVSGNLNHYQTLAAPVLEENKWTKVEISQTLIEGKYMYGILINGASVYTVENTQANRFEKVKMFAGDDWYTPVEGKIKNLSFESKDA